MENSRTKSEFIANMEQMSYGVKWYNHNKYITYTTPGGQKCRDNRLYEEIYLKERMEEIYGQRATQQIQRIKQNTVLGDRNTISAGETGKSVDEYGQFDGGISNQSADVCDTATDVRQADSDDDRNCEISGSDAKTNIGVTDMGGLEARHSADGQRSHEQSHARGEKVRIQPASGLSEANGNLKQEFEFHNYQQIKEHGKTTTSAGQYTDEKEMAVARDRSIDTGVVIGADTASKTLVLEAVRFIESLVVDKSEEEEKERQRQINTQKKATKTEKPQLRPWHGYVR